MIAALIAFHRKNYNECLEIFASDSFEFNLHSYNLLDKTLTALTPTVNSNDFLKLEIILNVGFEDYCISLFNLN